MKIDWVKKLTSRKFWLALASFVSMLIVAFGATEATAAQVSAIIMAGASVIGYILAEGLIDASSAPFYVVDEDDYEYDDEDEDEEEIDPDDVETIKYVLEDEEDEDEEYFED